MTIIHMDTEVTRGLAARLRESANSIEKSCSNITSSMNQVEWDGESSSDFKSRLSTALRGLTVYDELTCDAIRLIDEIEQWVTTDQKAVQTLKDKQTFWQFFVVSTGLDITGITSGIRAVINPYSLDEVWEYLQGTPSGKALEELAREHSTCFVFPDGTIVGDPNAATRYTVNFGDLSDGTGGAHNRYDLTIVINDDLLRKNKVDLAGILGHEMQHAVDATQGKMPLYPKIDGSESEAELEAIMAKWIDGRVYSEVRSYERQENIVLGTVYEDDGILTGGERGNFFKEHPGYRPSYERAITSIVSGYTADISVDPTTGELIVDLIPVGRPLSEFAYSA